MIFLSPLLLSISSNLETLRVSLSYGIKKIYFPKSISLLLAIIASISTFISMYIGKLILHLFNPELANIFGGILLSFIGIYFIVQFIRLEENRAGYDTSYYCESCLKCNNILENIDITKSNHIEIKECLNISLYLVLNSSFIYFAASITGASINLCVFFNFIVTLLCVYFKNFNLNIYKSIDKYSNLLTGIALLVLGICETFL